MFGLGRASLAVGPGPDSGAPPPPGASAGPPARQPVQSKPAPVRAARLATKGPGQILLHVHVYDDIYIYII